MSSGGGWYRDKTLSGTSFVIALPNYLFLSFAIVAVEHSSRYWEAAGATAVAVLVIAYALPLPGHGAWRHVEQWAAGREVDREVVGRRPEEFPAEARAQILARYPRHGFGSEFLACFQDQATRKPDSTAAASVANNAAGRIKANPLDG